MANVLERAWAEAAVRAAVVERQLIRLPGEVLPVQPWGKSDRRMTARLATRASLSGGATVDSGTGVRLGAGAPLGAAALTEQAARADAAIRTDKARSMAERAYGARAAPGNRGATPNLPPARARRRLRHAPSAPHGSMAGTGTSSRGTSAPPTRIGGSVDAGRGVSRVAAGSSRSRASTEPLAA